MNILFVFGPANGEWLEVTTPWFNIYDYGEIPSTVIFSPILKPKANYTAIYHYRLEVVETKDTYFPLMILQGYSLDNAIEQILLRYTK